MYEVRHLITSEANPESDFGHVIMKLNLQMQNDYPLFVKFRSEDFYELILDSNPMQA